MKRKFLSALVITAALFLTACQEDDTMDELIQDTNSISFEDGTGNGGSGDQGNGDDKPGGN